MTAAGIIFSNIHDANLPELTRMRTTASVPFACRYRFIDFALSNMVNSNIYNISVITHYNYQSLMDHLGSGKDWDLARRSGGIKILPPNITAYANGSNDLYRTRLEALKSVANAIARISDEYVVLSDCDVICNIDFNDMIEDHIKYVADMTIAVKHMKLSPGQAKMSVLYESDCDGKVTDILTYPVSFSGEADVSLNIVVMKTEYLQKIILDAVAHGYTSLTREVIFKNIRHANYRVYKYDGYFANILSFADYFACSMELLKSREARDSLFNIKSRPVYTKVRNSPPTYYCDDSSVKNSMVADGCVIHGTVENCILFRGVKIGRNTTVKNSILMQDTQVGENVYLNCVITDKNVVIKDSRMLSGIDDNPYYVPKGRML